jgi:TonB family protein
MSLRLWCFVLALPLMAQTMPDAAGVTVDTNGARLIHRMPVGYPAAAIADWAQGTVVAQVKLDGNGEVIDAAILSGPDALRKPVLQSVLGWHFMKSDAGSTRTVNVTFTLPKEAVNLPHPTAVVPLMRQGNFSPGPRVLKNITTEGIADSAREELLAKLPIHTGETITPESFEQVLAAVRMYDSHLLARIIVAPDGSGALQITAPGATGPAAPTTGQTIRVGGNVQANNLIRKVTPVYPVDAKAARIQGTVQLNATIASDGTVQDLQVISGHPLLAQAALDAVRQWVYRPTLLNGAPVTVVTTIDVNFTLVQ